MLRRWLVAAAALAGGAVVSVGVLLYGDPARGTAEYYSLARDVPAGAQLSADAVRLERLRLGRRADLAFARGSEGQLFQRRAAHDLLSGQLLQRSDLTASDQAGDRRLVWLPVKDMPAVSVGDRVDLLLLSGPPEHLNVAPFALGVEVRGVQPGGVVVAVTSRQATAFIYAGASVRLAAAVAQPGARAGQEGPVGSLEQAESEARR